MFRIFPTERAFPNAKNKQDGIAENKVKSIVTLIGFKI